MCPQSIRRGCPMSDLRAFKPTADQAMQFAMMLMAGMPGADSIRYFFEDEKDQAAMLDRWMASREVAAAIKKLQNDKDWQQMSLDERVRLAVDKTYNEMAWFLYSRNYSELGGAERAKADICRQALEAKIAGLAGKLDAITRFWDDVRSGRVVLAAPAPKVVISGVPQTVPGSTTASES